MTDQLFDLNERGGTGRNPVTNAGRVASNFYVDNTEYDERKRKGAAKSAYPDAIMDDTVFHTLPRDLCFLNRLRGGRRRGPNATGSMAAFAVFNGVDNKGMTKHQYLNTISLACLAGGQGATYGTKGREARHQGFAGVQGGLLTIKNTGPKAIGAGDLIYYDIPDFGSAPHMPRQVVKRITAFTRPYDPANDKASTRAVKEAFMVPPSTSDMGDMPQYQAAEVFKHVSTAMTVNAFEALLSSGLVAFDPAAMGTDDAAARQRAANARRWGGADREAAILRVARALKCKDVQDHAGTASIRMHGKASGSTSFAEYVHALFIFHDRARLMEVDGTTGAPADRNKGIVNRNQRALVSDMLNGIASANFTVQRRIFAKALSPIAPGKEGDVLFQPFMM